jgi:putative methylase
MLAKHKLAVALSRLKEHPDPKYFLEQYSITPGIAAEILWLARQDVKGKVVYDLGTGTGRFAIGAALVGARSVFGVDIDPVALEVARENASFIEMRSGVPVSKICKWVCKDIKELRASCDTVVQFPPFENDMIFFRKALEMARNVYSVHKATITTQQSVEKIVLEQAARISLYRRFRYYLPWRERSTIGYHVFLVVARKS